MVLNCALVSSSKRYWGDELGTYYALADPSFSHMLNAQTDLMNCVPPTYFLMSWPLAQVLGTDELTLRMFSCVGMIVALAATWWVLRDTFGFWPASVAVVVCFLGSSLVMYQVSEARFYGLFLAEISIAIVLAVRMTTRPNMSWKMLLANALLHGALVTTHYFGFLYSGAILIMVAGCLVGDRSRLIQCVASGVVGWTAFLPWIPAFIHHLEFSKPYGWIPRPGMAAVYSLFTLESANYGPAALLIVGVAIALRWLLADKCLSQNRPPRGGQAHFAPKTPQNEPVPDGYGHHHQEAVLAALMMGLLAVPVCIWVQSRLFAPMFLDRYFVADVIVWSFVFAYGVRAALSVLQVSPTDGQQPSAIRNRVAKWIPTTVFSLIALWYSAMVVFPHIGKSRPKLPDLIAGGGAGRPIVLESLNFFLPLQYYSDGTADYRFLLDREVAVEPKSGPANTLDQNGAALHRHYSELPIQTTEEFLGEHREFVVIDLPSFVWFERRIQNNPGYSWKELPELTAEFAKFGHVTSGLRALLVRPVEQSPAKGEKTAPSK